MGFSNRWAKNTKKVKKKTSDKINTKSYHIQIVYHMPAIVFSTFYGLIQFTNDSMFVYTII